MFATKPECLKRLRFAYEKRALAPLNRFSPVFRVNKNYYPKRPIELLFASLNSDLANLHSSSFLFTSRERRCQEIRRSSYLGVFAEQRELHDKQRARQKLFSFMNLVGNVLEFSELTLE
jgi:hypothetical protein